MYAAQFDYHRPTTVADAVDLLEDHEDARIMAGGQGLIPLLKRREVTPAVIVDIQNLTALDGIERTGNSVQIGALTTHADVLSSAVLEAAAPVLPETVSKITGGKQVHNFATIGGNISRAHPGYDYEGALVASGSAVVISGPDGERTVETGQFVRGACSTVLGEAELVTRIDVPAAEGYRSGGYSKRKEPASGGAIVGVATDITFATEKADVVHSAGVAVNGLEDTATRLEPVEEALVETDGDERAVRDAVSAARRSLDPQSVLDDKRASAEYRLSLLETHAVRSVTKALENATH
jgi:carbon-monoxide dehydrogenase medium subunit